MANWRSRVSIQLSTGLRLWSWQIEKNAWLTTVVNWGGLSGIIRSSPDLKVPPLKRPKRQAREFLSTRGLSGLFWRSCKVGLDRWCDKSRPDSVAQQLSTTSKGRSLRRCQCLSFTTTVTGTNSWCIHELEENMFLTDSWSIKLSNEWTKRPWQLESVP